MVKRIGGTRRKSRHKLSRSPSEKGKLSLRNYLQTFDEGDKVVLKIDSIMQKASPHPRFMGRAGIIGKKKGSCYEVKIKDIKKDKTLIVHPLHLKRS